MVSLLVLCRHNPGSMSIFNPNLSFMPNLSFVSTEDDLYKEAGTTFYQGHEKRYFLIRLKAD